MLTLCLIFVFLISATLIFQIAPLFTHSSRFSDGYVVCDSANRNEMNSHRIASIMNFTTIGILRAAPFECK